MKWNDLTMKERSDLMSLFLKHGIGSLSDMRRIYDGIHDNPEEDNWLVRARKNVTDWLGITNHYTDYRRNQRVTDAILKEYELANDPPGPAHRLPDGTISYGEKPLVNVDGLIAATVVPALGTGETLLNIGRGIITGNPVQVATSIIGAVVPGAAKGAIRKLNASIDTPEFKYRVREHARNQQLQEMMNYGPNSDILVHGDPAATGVQKVGNAIGYSDGKLTSFPHFENGNLVPGKGGVITEVYSGGINHTIEDRPIFWGDGRPFYETRVGNEKLFNDNKYINYLATQSHKYAKNRPNEFILESPYRYIATERTSTVSPVNTRQGVSRDMSEIQTKEVPVDKLWGIEWDPLIGTWGKTIYSPNGIFRKYGGLLHKYPDGEELEPAVVVADYPRNKEVLDIINSSNANWVRRLKDPNRQYIQDWEDPNSIATHKLSWACDNGKYYVYPNVQEINGRLYDFTNEKKYGKNGWRALDSAIYSGDVVEVPSAADARWFTESYKNFYPKFRK